MHTFFMDTVLDPLLAILGILVPLVVAYVIVFMQARKPDSCERRTSATVRNDLLQKRKESRAEETHTAR
jgi:hypothetical protein